MTEPGSSSRGIVLEGLDLLLTYRCTGECEICTYFCSPSAHGQLDRTAAVMALQEAARHPLRWVMLFGGEPFLVYDLLLDLARETRKVTDARIAVFTNAYWATSRSRARRLLGPLVEAGVDSVRFSLDAYHAEHVPPERVATAALTAAGLGLRTFVDATLSSLDDDPKGQRTRALVEDFRCRTGIEVSLAPLQSTGRAADLPQGPPGDVGRCALPSYLGSSLLSPSGVEIHPGGEVCLCAGLSIGDLGQNALGDILASYNPRGHPVIGPLLDGGPRALLEIAVARGHVEPHEARSEMTPCRACYLARTALAGEFPGVLRPLHCYGVHEVS